MERIKVLLLIACGAPIVAFAQTGPGGVGSSTNNVLWLSADHGAYQNAGSTLATNGQNVRQWNDRSGNARNAIQATSANRPNFFTNVLNGYPVLRYTASSNDRMAATGLSTANVASVFVVGRYTTLPSPNPGLVQGTPSGSAYTSDAGLKSIGMWVSSANTRLWGRGVQSNGAQRQIAQVTPLASNTPYLLNTVYDGSVIQQYVDNATSGSETYNGTLQSWTDMAIGAQHGTESWNGDIAEVIVYNTNVNTAQRIIIANYLAAKYGRPLAANNVYREDDPARGNFDHEVAGIGRIDAANLNTAAQGTGIVRIDNPTGLDNDEFLMWGHDNGMLGAWGVGDLPDGVQGRLERVWRVSERNTSGTAAVDVGTVDITFDLAGLGNVDPAHLRLIVDTDNDGVFANEVALSGAVSAGGDSYRFEGVDLLEDGVRFTLGTTNLAVTPLPIELISFTAEASSGGVVALEWVTAAEWDNDHFEVERSQDMASWRVLERLDAVGHSVVVNTYRTMDPDPSTGINYYRLVQTDLDGTSTSSAVVAVDMTRATREAFVHPNPTSGPVYVHMPGLSQGIVSITVLDGAGRIVLQQDKLIEAGQPLQMDLQDRPAGIYTMLLGVAGRSEAVRFNVER